jgi:structural maintenance of chromosome 3 (chondroitin sulfate proteoglycan 6)
MSTPFTTLHSATANDVAADVQQLEETDLPALEQQVASKEELAASLTADIQRLGQELINLKQARNTATENRKALWGEQNKEQETLNNIQQSLNKSDRAMKSTMSPSLALGHQAVEALSQDPRIRGTIYGPLIGLMKTPNPNYNTAIEVVAGNRLFHIVVDTDDTAEEIMDIMEKDKSGRVTFIPLNRLRKNNTGRPMVEAEQTISLLQTIEPTHAKYLPAFEQIFGSTLLCSNLEDAAKHSEELDVDCVTLDGDEARRRGVFSGGSRGDAGSRGTSRLKLFSQTLDLQSEQNDVFENLQMLENDLKTVEKEVTALLTSMQKTENARKSARQQYAQVMTTLETLRAERRERMESLVRQQETLREVTASITAMETRIEALTLEMQSPMVATLTRQQIDELRSARATSSELALELRRRQTRVDNARIEMKTVETRLTSNLERRLAEIQHALASGTVSTNAGAAATVSVGEEGSEGEESSMINSSSRSLTEIREHLELSQDKAERAQKALEVAENTVTTLRVKLTNHTEDLRRNQEEFDETQRIAAEQMEQLNSSQKQLEKLLGKRNLKVQQRDQAVRKIRELGTLPSSELGQYKELRKKVLEQKIKSCNDKLKKFTKVNKKALNQYVSFNDQQAKLLDQKTDLEKGDGAIKTLVDHLDLKKDEAILKTFRSVQKHFRQVFKELVPTGSGALILQRKDNPDLEDDEILEDDDGSLSMVESEDDDGDEDDGDSDNENNDSTRNRAQKKRAKKKKQEKRAAKRQKHADKMKATVESFSGVAVRVNFAGEKDTSMTKRLSGGQKDIVALAIILSIQRADPGPFYLFDELDAALDDVRRAAVATLISKQSHDEHNPAQFITSTFRPELVNVADAHIGVSQSKKASVVRSLSKKEAAQFLMAKNQSIQRKPSYANAAGNDDAGTFGGAQLSSKKRSRP